MNNEFYKSEKENGTPLNWFFKDQLKAFDMWLRYGADKHIPPQQLPVVLQVLLSQVCFAATSFICLQFFWC